MASQTLLGRRSLARRGESEFQLSIDPRLSSDARALKARDRLDPQRASVLAGMNGEMERMTVTKLAPAIAGWWLAVMSVAGLLAGQEAAPAASPIPPAPERPALLQPLIPDLASLAPEVSERIRDSHELLLAELEAADQAPNAYLGQLYGELGMLYHGAGLAEPAAVCYQNAARLRPEDGRWPYYLGFLRQQLGELDAAEAAYQDTLRLAPFDRPTLFRIGEVRLAQKRLEEAAEPLRKILQIDPRHAAAEAMLGRIASLADDAEATVAHLERALALAPQASKLHYPLGMALRKLGREDEARVFLSKGGAVDPPMRDPLLAALAETGGPSRFDQLRGRLAFARGIVANAAEAFGAAVEKDPRSASARQAYGVALANLGDAIYAFDQLDEAARLDPDDPATHYALGVLLAQQQALWSARFHLARAADLEPTDAAAHRELAAVLRRQRDPAQAIERYRVALALSPRDPQALLGLAQCRIDLGQLSEAKAGLEEALVLVPEAVGIRSNLARLLAAAPDLELRDGARAYEIASKLFDAEPAAVHAETVALALAESGRCQEAAGWQLKVIDAYRKAGQTDRVADAEEVLLHYAGQPCRPPGRSPAG